MEAASSFIYLFWWLAGILLSDRGGYFGGCASFWKECCVVLGGHVCTTRFRTLSSWYSSKTSDVYELGTVWLRRNITSIAGSHAI